MAIFTIIFLLLLCAAMLRVIYKQNQEAGLRELKIQSLEKRATELATQNSGYEGWLTMVREERDEAKENLNRCGVLRAVVGEQRDYWRKQCQTERTKAGKAHLTPPWERK